MEDIPRGLEKELIAQAQPKKTRRRKRWNLMLVGESGELVKIRWARGIAIFLAVLLTTSLVAAGGLSYFCKYLLEQNHRLTDTVRNMEVAAKGVQAETDSLMARLAVAEAGDKSGGQGLPGKSEVPAVATKKRTTKKRLAEKRLAEKKLAEKKLAEKKAAKKKAAKKKAAEKRIARPVETASSTAGGIGRELSGTSGGAEAGNAAEIHVAVEGVEVFAPSGEEGVSVKFVIKNQTSSPGNISGRIFAVLKPDPKRSSDWRVSPGTALVAGKPADAAKGQFFSISRYKTVKFALGGGRHVDAYRVCTVLVYNAAGKLILEKDFTL